MSNFNDSLPLLLDIKNDFVFKQVFGIEKNKNVLMSFLNAILKGNPKIIDLELLNTDSPKLIKNGLGIRLDVKAKISDNTFVDSEGFDIKIIAKCLGISEAKVEELLK
ncbi:MAG: PD-(D/E)XK nuclease family transposase [Alphaproteobacteria bacterium]|nr:PD-(D/E)XK nuclease family transposase [Alphaproteobacteria bacterium]